VVLLLVAGFLAMVAASSWFSYVAQGIAYGDLAGVPGRERDLAAIASHARLALKIAASSEALGIAALCWAFTAAFKPTWLRACFALGLACLADVCTLAIVRGL